MKAADTLPDGDPRLHDLGPAMIAKEMQDRHPDRWAEMQSRR